MTDREIIWCSPDEITCAVAEDGKSITFMPCGRTSYNSGDVSNRYCAACHRFMDLVEIASALKKDLFP